MSIWFWEIYWGDKMKSYKNLMKELLEDEKFRKIHLKKEALHHILDEIIKLRKEKKLFFKKIC